MSAVIEERETGVTLTGEYVRQIYQKPGSPWGIHLLQMEDGSALKVTGESDNDFRPGMLVTLYGDYQDDDRYGRGFKATSILTYVPDVTVTFPVFAAWLRSGVIKHLGVVRANAVLQTFGEGTREALSDAERLLRVSGIGPVIAPEIVADWNNKSADYRLAGMLHGLGLRGAEIRQTVRYFMENPTGDLPPDIEAFGRYLLDNPYRLTEVAGIGFHRADDIAARMNVSEESPLRMASALQYAVRRLCEERGHTLLLDGWIVDFACGESVLNGDFEDLLWPALDTLASGEVPRLVEMAPGFYAPKLYYDAETRIWEKVEVSASVRAPVVPEHVVTQALARFPFLVEEQKAAVHLLLSRSFAALTGGPGTGKTTCIQAVCEALRLAGKPVRLLAPSGKAAARISESSGLPAATIHRALFQLDGEGVSFFDAGTVILVDEASMVDSWLLAWLLSHMGPTNSLFLVGDVDQLPSVGPGRVFGDILESGEIPVGRLVLNHRSPDIAGIPRLAASLLAARIPGHAESRELADSGACPIYLERREQASVWEDTVEAVIRGWREEGVSSEDVQVLTPMRKGPMGVFALNRLLRSLLVPQGEECVLGSDEGGPISWRAGDRVIQLRNQYRGRTEPLFNGDLGDVIDVTDKTVTVRFQKFKDDDAEACVTYGADDIDMIQHAFAMTIHKSQGSEFVHTLLVLSPQHRHMATRALIYTGVTRARVSLVLLTERGVLQHAVSREDSIRETVLYRFFEGF